MARRLVIALLAIISLTPSPANAGEADIIALAVAGVDTAIPSVWAEFQSGEPVRALLVWNVAPINFRLFGVGRKVQTTISEQCRETRAIDVFLIPFVEPQIRPASTEYRIAFGGALPIVGSKKPVGVHLDGGYLLGSDGIGWFAGGGVTFGPSAFAPWGFRVALTVRWVETPDTARVNTGLDFTSALYPASWGRVFTGAETKPLARVCESSTKSPRPEPLPSDDELDATPEKREMPACDPVGVSCDDACGATLDDGCGGTIECPPCPVEPSTMGGTESSGESEKDCARFDAIECTDEERARWEQLQRQYDLEGPQTCDPVGVDCSGACGDEIDDGCGGVIQCPPCQEKLPRD